MGELIAEGDRLYRSGDPGKAIEAYRRAQRLAGRAPLDVVQSRIHYLEGIQAANRNDLALAGELFARALAEARRAGERRREGRCLHACGNIALRRDDYPHAEAFYRAALEIARESQEPDRLLTLSLRGMGDVASGRGRNDEALGYYEQALAAARRASDRQNVEGVLNSIGSIYLELADYTRALQSFQEGLRIGTDDKSELSYVLNNLGIIYGNQGNSDLAIAYFRRALRMAEEAEDDYARMRVLNNIGAFHEGERRFEQARQCFAAALRLAQQVGDRSAMPHHWHNLGSVYEEQKRYALAGQAYRQSLALAESIGDHNLVSQALAGMGRIELLENDPRRALELADRAASLAAETGSRETFWRARTLAGRALQAQGRVAAARTAFHEAIATLEGVRSRMPGGDLERQGFFDWRIEPYRRLIELAADSGEATAALALAEHTKGRVLLEILRAGRIDLASPLSTEERAAEQRLRERLASLNAELFLARSRAPASAGALPDLERRLQQARRELEAFNTTLYAARPGLRTRRADFPAWTLEKAAELLNGGGTALIEYAALEEKTFLFTVTADGEGSPKVRLYRLPVGREDLQREVEAFRGMLAARDLGFRGPARRLYDLLLAPAASELRGHETLCIVPDGPLWDLPFQALQPDGSSVLLEQHAVFLAPSLSFLSELRSRKVNRPSRAATLLAVGDPEPGAAAMSLASTLRSRLARLPEAAREVRSLAQLYGAGRSAVYTAAAASEERVKTEAGKYRVLHFATHALLDDRNPMYSSLVLAQIRPRGGEDGLLEAWELFDLHLEADLVVLSACQTARGRPRAGEGVIGMTWALAAAGSPATLASQWEVDSASTSQLMLAFHHGWLAGLSRAEALRRAALATRAEERYRHPFYWAAFVLVGEGD